MSFLVNSFLTETGTEIQIEFQFSNAKDTAKCLQKFISPELVEAGMETTVQNGNGALGRMYYYL